MSGDVGGPDEGENAEAGRTGGAGADDPGTGRTGAASAAVGSARGNGANSASPPGIPLVTKRELVAWREGTRTRVAELAALNTWIFQEYERESKLDERSISELHSAINRHLKAALEATAGKSWWWQVRREGARLERAISNLDAAEAYLLRIAPSAFVLGQLPSVLNQVQRQLAESDPRRKQIEAIAKVLGVNEADKPPQVVPAGSSDTRLDLIEQERGTIVGGLRGASSAALREQTRLQSFRNVVVVTTVAMAIVAIALAVVGWHNPTAVPLCFAPEENDLTTIVCPTQESEPFRRQAAPSADASTERTMDTTAPATTEGTQPDETVPQDTTVPPPGTLTDGETPSSGSRDIDEVLRETVGPGNIAIVELIGVTAAAIAAAGAIRRVRGSSEPYGVPIALALLKLPTGAVTAFLGLLLMRGGFVPGLSALDTSAQILAWAIIFGYAQQLFTRLVDEKAHTVLDAVRGGNE